MRVNIGLGGWIIADGNYPGFRKGEEAKFALEFRSEKGLTPTTRKEKTLKPLHEVRPLYEVSGLTIYANPKAWVCDFGLLTYRETSKMPDWADTGVSCTGSAYIGVDPFDYKERLHKLSGMPKLTYLVAIRRIFRDTTPLIEKNSRPPVMMRDPTRTSYEEVEATGTPRDNRRRGPSDHFVLECDIIQAGLEPFSYRKNPWREWREARR